MNENKSVIFGLLLSKIIINKIFLPYLVLLLQGTAKLVYNCKKYLLSVAKTMPCPPHFGINLTATAFGKSTPFTKSAACLRHYEKWEELIMKRFFPIYNQSLLYITYLPQTLSQSRRISNFYKVGFILNRKNS